MGGDRNLPRQMEYIRKGARFITTNSEIAFIMAEATRVTTELRKALESEGEGKVRGEEVMRGGVRRRMVLPNRHRQDSRAHGEGLSCRGNHRRIPSPRHFPERPAPRRCAGPDIVGQLYCYSSVFPWHRLCWI